MKNCTFNLILKVTLIMLFALYIYLYNLRESQNRDAYFPQEADIYCKNTCFSKNQVKISARIISPPQEYAHSKVLRYRGVIVIVDADQDLSVGDQITVIGTLSKRMIDHKKYEYRLIKTSIASIEYARNLPAYNPYRILSMLSKLPYLIDQRLRQLYVGEQASLVAGIVFGMRNSLSHEFVNALINTGTIHIIAASGYNISVFSGFCLLLFMRLFSRKTALIWTALVIVFYCALAGFGEPIVRASLMAGLLLLAQGVGRHYQATRSLLAVSILMLLVEPALVTSVSFLLSVSATGGILFLEPLFKKGISLFNQSDGKSTILGTLGHVFAGDLLTTISASVATFPILMIYFDTYNIYSVLVNCLVLWVIPPIMFLGLFSLLASFVSSYLALFFTLLAKPFLWYFSTVVMWSNNHLNLVLSDFRLNWWFGFGYYFLLFSIYIFMHKKVDV